MCVGRAVPGGKGSDLFAGWREGLRLRVAAGKLGALVCDASVFSRMWEGGCLQVKVKA